MPDLAEELHGRRGEGVVLGEAQLGGEDAAFERGAFGTLDQRFPVQEVVFRDGAGGDAFWRVVGQGAVFLEEPPVRGGLCHFVCVVFSYCDAAKRYQVEGRWVVREDSRV